MYSKIVVWAENLFMYRQPKQSLMCKVLTHWCLLRFEGIVVLRIWDALFVVHIRNVEDEVCFVELLSTRGIASNDTHPSYILVAKLSLMLH